MGRARRTDSRRAYRGPTTAEKAERDNGRAPGVTTEMAARLKAPGRDNRELGHANEVLRKVRAYFAQTELDRRFKP